MHPEAARWLQQALQQLNSAVATLQSVRDRERAVTSAELIPALVALNGAVAMTATAVWLMDHLPPLEPPPYLPSHPRLRHTYQQATVR